jgi:hypothetical protein
VKASEYGGSDTNRTQGIQPAPHQVTQTEALRLMYATDPASTDPPDATLPKKSVPNDPVPPPHIQEV